MSIERITYKHIWLIAYPILLSLLAEHMILLTDTAFLGRVGEVELGGLGIAGVFYIAIFVLGFGFSMGAQIMIGRRNGEKRYAEIGPLMVQGCFFLLVLALGIVLFTRTFGPRILSDVLASDHVLAAALGYLDWRIYGLFFAFIGLMFRGFFVGIEQTKILTVNAIVMVSANVLLNYLLIFGKWGFPAMGIAGAGLAAAIAESISVVFYLAYVWLRVDLAKYGLRLVMGFDPKEVGRILSVSIWSMAQYLLGVSIWFVFFVAVEHLGERSIAVSNIVRSFTTFLFMPISAFGAASVTITSNLMGKGQHEQVIGSCRKVISLCYLVLLPFMVVGFIFPDIFLRIYTDNSDLIASAMPSMRVAIGSILITIPSCILFQTVSGTGNTRAALLMDLGPICLYFAYIYYVAMQWRMDVAICWGSEYVYWGSVLLVAYLYMKRAKWHQKKI